MAGHGHGKTTGSQQVKVERSPQGPLRRERSHVNSRADHRCAHPTGPQMDKRCSGERCCRIREFPSSTRPFATSFLLPWRNPPTARWSPPKFGELKDNNGKIFKFGSKPGLLVRTADGTYRAFSAVCTHLNCTVQYRDDLHEIWCACHNGLYDLEGRNVSGPPPRPLEVFEVHVQGEDVVVTRNG